MPWATSDSAFRQRLVDDPHAAVRDELGVTQMHVSRLLGRILERLRRELG